MEDHDEAALRALGIDPSDVANAETSRRAFVMESRREFGNNVSSEEGGNEEDFENDEDDNVGEEE